MISDQRGVNAKTGGCVSWRLGAEGLTSHGVIISIIFHPNSASTVRPGSVGVTAARPSTTTADPQTELSHTAAAVFGQAAEKNKRKEKKNFNSNKTLRFL